MQFLFLAMQEKILEKIDAEWSKRSPCHATMLAYLNQDFVDRREFITSLTKDNKRHETILKKYPCFKEPRLVIPSSAFSAKVSFDYPLPLPRWGQLFFSTFRIEKKTNDSFKKTNKKK